MKTTDQHMTETAQHPTGAHIHGGKGMGGAGSRLGPDASLEIWSKDALVLGQPIARIIVCAEARAGVADPQEAIAMARTALEASRKVFECFDNRADWPDMQAALTATSAALRAISATK